MFMPTGLRFSVDAWLPADLTALTSALEGVSAPSSSAASQSLFLRTVSSILTQYESKIDAAVLTAVQAYNASLL